MDFDFKKLIEYSDIKNDVIGQAANALCQHFQCRYEDLILERTSRFPDQILRKADSAKGLAYLIKRVFAEDSVRVVAEPIFF